ncbi:MAG: DUF4936 family protein [Rhizobiales bacterium]|nr:DUF4936 family protein [Rhizobacter sp.]
MRELFVYYRVREVDAAAARTAAQQMQATLRARHSGLTARLLMRPETRDGEQTWMETYAVDAVAAVDGVGQSLQSAIEAEAGALQPFLAGPRHTEVFVACAS